MSSSPAFLGSLALVAVSIGCDGAREQPTVQEDGNLIVSTNAGAGNQGGDPSTGGAGGMGAGMATGGAGGTGGIGGAGTGGMGTGGMGAGGMGAGTGGMGTGGAGGAPPVMNQVEAIYPYCGCITDSHEPGACANCTALQTTLVGACQTQFADCAAGCQSMYNALQNCNALADPGCLDTIFQMAPREWDDLVSVVSCECEACPAPDQCDNAACP